MREKPVMMPGVITASPPPVRTTSSSPQATRRAAYPIASADDVQPVVITWERPLRPKRIEISDESVPIVPVGIE